MKSRISNFIWIGIAFVIGLSINNACADNLSPNNSGVLEVLDELREELDSLKNDVADLRRRLMDNGSTIDGLRFGPDGRVCSRPVKREGAVGKLESYIQGGFSQMTYEYDDKGRLSVIKILEDPITVTASITYVEKTETINLTNCFLTPEGRTISSDYTEKIYYE